MKPSSRLILAICLAIAVVVAPGCGGKQAAKTSEKTSTKASAPAPAKQAKSAPAKSTGTAATDVGGFTLPGVSDSPIAKAPASAQASAPMPKQAPVRPIRVPKITGPQLLSAMQASYRRFTSIKAVGVASNVSKADGKTVGRPVNARITMLFARPDKVSIDSGESRLVTDGRTLYSYITTAKRYIKQPVTGQTIRELATSRPGVGVMGLLLGVPYAKMISSCKIIGETNVSGHDVYALSITLKQGSGCPKGVDARQILLVGKDDLGIYRSQLVLRYKPRAAKGFKGKVPKLVESSFSTALTTFQANAKLSPSVFKFRPPAGAKLYEEPKPVDLSGDAAPDFSFKWTDGAIKKLSDFRGKPVLLDFWALPMCADQLPVLQKISEQRKDVQVITINVNSKVDKVQEYLKSKKLDFPVAYANQEIVKVGVQGYKVVALPTMFLIDEKGVIREVFVGNHTVKAIGAKIDKAEAK